MVEQILLSETARLIRKKMTFKNTIVVLLFLLSFGLMEVHRLVPASSHKLALFIASNEAQSLRWYVKDTCNMAITILILIAIRISLKPSFIKSIVNILLCFHLFDFCMYWYDFKQSEVFYIVAYFLVFLSVIFLICKWKQY